MIEYVGEHTFLAALGRSFVIMAFVGAIFSVITNFLHTRNSDAKWKTMGRFGFLAHTIGVLGIVAVLFHLLVNHYFEFNYVWKHSNSTMPMRYILSCFWEGQEGSFLLWIFWHVVLGWLLIWRSNVWEPWVMTIVSLVQVFLTSMLLGIYVGEFKIGSNPFLLMRQLPDYIGLPWTQAANYLDLIPQFKDGKGLNPLLQNYWMTIHPPTLFLGFSATLIPFAYAIAGLWRGELKSWIKPALPWTVFGVMILGVGILMGGAWAYEALSFGGFWAWDPVENASLVPWLILLGAMHLMLINLKKDTSLFSTLLLTMLSFILILYSTFLTRSGVLGDTSVHSFTGDGMIGQLLLYLLFFVALSLFLLIQGKKHKLIFGVVTLVLLSIGLFGYPELCIGLFLVFSLFMLIVNYQTNFPKNKEEEGLWTREFWLFIGALVLTLSAGQIIFSTSTPVINKLLTPMSGMFQTLFDWTSMTIFETLGKANLAPPSDAISHYNKWQIPFAFIITLLIAVGQYFNYRKTPMNRFVKRLALAFVLAIVMTGVTVLFVGDQWQNVSLVALLFSGFFALFANLHYWLAVLKGKWNHAGSSIAHIGFALVMLGALISTSQSVKISENTSNIDVSQLSEDFSNSDEILLFRGDTLNMNEYFISYREKQTEGVNIFYVVDYFDKKDKYYQANELVLASGSLFKCINAHKASASFLTDLPKWEKLSDPTKDDFKNAQLWNSHAIGDFLFTLYPRIQINPQFGNVPEPDTKHYLLKDVYTHVKWAELEDRDLDEDGFRPASEHKMKLKDTISTSQHLIVLDKIRLIKAEEKDSLRLLPNDFAAAMDFTLINGAGMESKASPLLIYRDSILFVPDQFISEEEGLKFSITKLDPNNGVTTVLVAEHESQVKEFMVMQAIVFPGINILWLGCILMFLGSLLAVIHRVKKDRK
jgi:cytochrome c-type biogenesis protein CcmF